MEEQATSAVKNKGLLIAAGVIGLLVVVVYMFHMDRVAKMNRGEIVKVIVVSRTYEAGEPLDIKDLEVKEIRTRFSKGLGDVVTGQDPEEVAGDNAPVLRAIHKDEFLRWSHVSVTDINTPSDIIEKGKVSYTVSIDPATSPGMMCNVGDRVTLIGKLALKGQPMKYYPLIKGVKVRAIGGLAAKTVISRGKRRTISQGNRRTYRSISIEVSLNTAVQLANVKSHVQGPIQVVVHSRKDVSGSSKFSKNPMVEPGLENLKAVDVRRRSGDR